LDRPTSQARELRIRSQAAAGDEHGAALALPRIQSPDPPALPVAFHARQWEGRAPCRALTVLIRHCCFSARRATHLTTAFFGRTRELGARTFEAV